MARQINILAVDDTPANLVTLDAVLGDSYNLVRAASGDEALEVLESRDDIDLILMDVQLPGLDGFETAALIKKMESARHIPIVFVSAIYQEDPWISKGYAAGGIDYFSRPFDAELLKLKIGIYADMKQKADALKARERELDLSEELLAIARDLSTAFEKAATGLIIADVDGNVRQMNDEVIRIFNCRKQAGSRAEVETGALEGSKRFICDQLGALMTEIRDGRKLRRELLRIRCGDGSEKTVVCLVSVLRDMDATAAGVAIVIHDVSRSKRIEGDLAHRVAELTSVGK